MEYPRQNILGVLVSAINVVQALSFVENCIDEKQREYICVKPAHGIMDCQHDKKLCSNFNHSGLTTPAVEKVHSISTIHNIGVRSNRRDKKVREIKNV